MAELPLCAGLIFALRCSGSKSEEGCAACGVEPIVEFDEGPAELEQAMNDGVDARYGSSLNTQSSSPNTLLCCSTRGLVPT